MPFSHHPVVEATETPAPDLPLVGGRYALRHCMAETALGKVYWACEQTQSTDTSCNVLVFTILPALAHNSVFEQALRQVLPTYRQPLPFQPTVTADGKENDGTRWFALQNIRGMLLSERLQELDDRGMPQAEAMEILDGLCQAIGHHHPSGVFGFLEPGAALNDGQHYCLLNAPVVAALRLANTGIIHTSDNRQTFHSGFISPEVALGDQAESSDDTFSLACIAYHLLSGHPPFGKQTTLEAAIRNTLPPAINKLKPETWAALRQGLNLKRALRQSSPTDLLRHLNRRPRPRLLLPIAALGVASLAGYAGYHILLDAPPSPTHTPVQTHAVDSATALTPTETAPAPQLVNEPSLPASNTASIVAPNHDTQATKTAEEARIEAIKREAEAQAKAEVTAALQAETAATLSEAQRKTLEQLLQQAKDAMQAGKLFSNDPAKPAAADYLKKAFALDAENTAAKKLLLQMVDDQHNEAETLLKAQRYDEVDKVLLTADKLITEFNLGESLSRQMQLEAQTDQAIRAKTEAENFIDSANRAIDYGNLMRGDHRSDSAASYLAALFEAHPKHAEGMKVLRRIIRSQHEQAMAALQRRNIETARTLLDDSQKLIGQYTLDDLVEAQLELEKRYRDSQTMGIFPASSPTGTSTSATTGRKPEMAAPAPNTAKLPDATPKDSASTAAADTPPAAMESPAPVSEQPNPLATDKTANDLPVTEVHVSPDTPITPTSTAADHAPIELPPVQIDPQPESTTSSTGSLSDHLQETEPTAPEPPIEEASTPVELNPNVSGIDELQLDLEDAQPPATDKESN